MKKVSYRCEEEKSWYRKPLILPPRYMKVSIGRGTDRPYIVHPMEVGKIVSTMTQDEEIISAAILHDTIEDCEGVDANVLKEMFSARVAGIVSQESEDKSKTWMERKSATIERLKTAPIEVQMIGLADKLSNMRGY